MIDIFLTCFPDFYIIHNKFNDIKMYLIFYFNFVRIEEYSLIFYITISFFDINTNIRSIIV